MFLIDKLLRKNPTFAVLSSVVLAIVYIMIMKYTGAEIYFYEGSPSRNLFSMLLNSILFIGLSYAAFFIFENQRKEKENYQLQLQNKKLHLDYMKSRINPHFVFNTLNNLNALIQIGSKDGIKLANGLSDILRYALDSGDKSFVELSKEIEHIQSYAKLVLMQEPLSSDIDIYVEGVEKDFVILPFILITLFENAIKHSDIKINPQGYIKVDILIEDFLVFKIKNSCLNNEINNSGTGIKNITQQLNIAYGENYTLDYSLKDQEYILELTINTNNLRKS